MEVRRQLFSLYKVMVCVVEREREREREHNFFFFLIQDIHKNDKLVATTT